MNSEILETFTQLSSSFARDRLEEIPGCDVRFTSQEIRF